MAKGKKRKHVPQRTCIACSTTRPKRELVRIVRTPEGEIIIDERGKHNGRGAYLCAQQVCWREALARRRFDTALRTSLNKTTRTMLETYAQALPERLETADTAEDIPVRR